MKESGVINCVEEAVKLGFIVQDEFSEGHFTKRLMAIMKTVARRQGWRLNKVLVTKEYPIEQDWSLEKTLIFGVDVENALYSINEEVKEFGINDVRNFVLGTGKIIYDGANKMPFILGVL